MLHGWYTGTWELLPFWCEQQSGNIRMTWNKTLGPVPVASIRCSNMDSSKLSSGTRTKNEMFMRYIHALRFYHFIHGPIVQVVYKLLSESCKNISFLLHDLWLNWVTILHMHWQTNCQHMCKIVTQLNHRNMIRAKVHFCKIWTVSSWFVKWMSGVVWVMESLNCWIWLKFFFSACSLS